MKRVRVCIVHGWDGYPEEGWFPWLKKELQKRNFSVFVPQMPTNPPTMKDWVPHIAKVLGRADKDTYLVGHSAGCITILRYLEGLDEEKAGGAVLVAGFSDDLGFKELSNFFERPVEWNKIKKHCRKFVAINSDDDKYVPLKHGKIFKEKLGAEFIVEHIKGHFYGSEGTFKIPSVLDAVLRISGENT